MDEENVIQEENEIQDSEKTKAFTMRLEESLIAEISRLAREYKSNASEIIKISLRIALPETEKRLNAIQIARGLSESIVKED